MRLSESDAEKITDGSQNSAADAVWGIMCARRRLLRLVEQFLQPDRPPRQPRARTHTRDPASAARTTLRLAERRRARREPAEQERHQSHRREGRLLQWWTAIGTVLAGLVAIPALIISMNALKISEQQRADVLRQRVEDQRKAEEERAASYARNITHNREGDLIGWVHAKDGLRIGDLWISNRNTGEVTVWSVAQQIDGESRVRTVRVPPCTAIKVEKTVIADYAVFNPVDRRIWSVTPSGQSNGRLGSGLPLFDAIDRARAGASYPLEILAQRRLEPCG